MYDNEDTKTPKYLTDYGTGHRGRWRFNKTTGTWEPIVKKAPKVVDAPWVQTDEIPATESMVDDQRRMFTSKAKLLQHYKDNGYECTYGERQKNKEFAPDADSMVNDWREAERLCKWGMAPFNEREKQANLDDQRREEEWKKRNLPRH